MNQEAIVIKVFFCKDDLEKYTKYVQVQEKQQMKNREI